MRYVISENRLHEFMTSYLDRMMKSNIILRNDPYVYIERPDQDEEDIFQYMEWDRIDGRLWINIYFLEQFRDIFPLNLKESREFIKNWFENRFEVEVKFVE